MPAFSPLTDSSVASQLPEGLTVLSFLIAASLTMAATTTRPSTQVANFGTSPKPSQTQAGASGICNLPISEERMAVTSAHREEKEAEAKLDHPEESEIDEVHSARPPGICDGPHDDRTQERGKLRGHRERTGIEGAAVVCRSSAHPFMVDEAARDCQFQQRVEREFLRLVARTAPRYQLEIPERPVVALERGAQNCGRLAGGLTKLGGYCWGGKPSVSRSAAGAPERRLRKNRRLYPGRK